VVVLTFVALMYGVVGLLAVPFTALTLMLAWASSMLDPSQPSQRALWLAFRVIMIAILAGFVTAFVLAIVGLWK
jgi:hypothetical protein